MPTLDPATPPVHLSAFSGFGIELEYMLVDRNSFRVVPVCDRIIQAVAGEVVNETGQGALAWSNELVAHVIELKTNGPASTLAGLSSAFHRDIARINAIAAPLGACLMPTAMHPFFDPDTETVLWPHGQNDIYAAYDRIFSCRGHGWSNLQSMHINLPFADDEEFRRLHGAIRVLLPIIPALAASSPIVGGQLTGWLDSRLDFYRNNQALVPEIAGRIVPEPVDSIAAYRQQILEPMYAAIAPRDPAGILADDWLNSRGAIARFDRQTIEIRIIDIQECPSADLAIARTVTRIIQALYEERIAPLAMQQACPTGQLAAMLLDAARLGPVAPMHCAKLAEVFGVAVATPVGEVWAELIARYGDPELAPEEAAALSMIQSRGTLAERMVRHLAGRPDSERLIGLSRELCQCLADNRPLPG